MTLTYFKRFRMEINLQQVSLDIPDLPDEYDLLPWRIQLTRDHAKAKWECFHNEIDANVFPCLGDRRGCLKLMRDIAGRSNFVPEATWLLVHRSDAPHSIEPIGTVQGLRTEAHLGSIQNLGIIPEYRGRGLGSVLLMAALRGFADVGCMKADLEVTSHNTAAIRLYQRLGFERAETVFKVADVAMA